MRFDDDGRLDVRPYLNLMLSRFEEVNCRQSFHLAKAIENEIKCSLAPDDPAWNQAMNGNVKLVDCNWLGDNLLQRLEITLKREREKYTKPGETDERIEDDLDLIYRLAFNEYHENYFSKEETRKSTTFVDPGILDKRYISSKHTDLIFSMVDEIYASVVMDEVYGSLKGYDFKGEGKREKGLLSEYDEDLGEVIDKAIRKGTLSDRDEGGKWDVRQILNSLLDQLNEKKALYLALHIECARCQTEEQSTPKNVGKALNMEIGVQDWLGRNMVQDIIEEFDAWIDTMAQHFTNTVEGSDRFGSTMFTFFTGKTRESFDVNRATYGDMFALLDASKLDIAKLKERLT